MERYGWLEHDGRNFGVQEILDKFIKLETSFVTRGGGDHGGDWTARIRVEPRVSTVRNVWQDGKTIFTLFRPLDEAVGGRASDVDVLLDVRRQW